MRRTPVVPAAIVAAAAVLAWLFWPEGDDRAIKRRLNELVEHVNESGAEGLGTVTRATEIGAYFTDDVVVDLGQGTAPIAGRETLIGMAARFQPSTTASVVSLEDVTVATRPGTAIADVALTVTLTGRDARTGEQTMDARELTLEMRKDSGEWLIARATAVDTLKQVWRGAQSPASRIGVQSKVEGQKPSTSDEPGRGRVSPGNGGGEPAFMADEAGGQPAGTGG